MLNYVDSLEDNEIDEIDDELSDDDLIDTDEVDDDPLGEKGEDNY